MADMFLYLWRGEALTVGTKYRVWGLADVTVVLRNPSCACLSDILA